MNYCSQCGSPVELRIPDGDSLARHVCDACGTIHYQNPRIVAGCIPEAPDGRLLLCRRAIDPRDGYWTMPSGFMENGETLAEAALRETLEEACAHVELVALSSIITVVHARQVHMMYRARLLDDDYAAGAETREVRMFDEREIPWDALAFPSVRIALERYLADRGEGRYRLHETMIRRNVAESRP